MNKTGKFLFSETDSIPGLLPLQNVFSICLLGQRFLKPPVCWVLHWTLGKDELDMQLALEHGGRDPGKPLLVPALYGLTFLTTTSIVPVPPG